MMFEDGGGLKAQPDMDSIRQMLVTRWICLSFVVCTAGSLASCSTFPWFPTPDVERSIEVAPPEPEEVYVAPEPEVGTTTEAPAVVEEAAPAIPRPVEKPKVTPPRPPVAEAETVPVVAPEKLVGVELATVLTVLRSPDAVQQNALSIAWTYSGADCTLQLFFYPDIGTTRYHLLKYDLKDGAGKKLVNSVACMRQFMTTRNDGALIQ